MEIVRRGKVMSHVSGISRVTMVILDMLVKPILIRDFSKEFFRKTNSNTCLNRFMHEFFSSDFSDIYISIIQYILTFRGCYK